VAQYKTVQDLAELEAQRAQRLLEGGVGNQERVDHAQNSLASARSRVTWAAAQLESSTQGITTAESHLAVAGSGVTEAHARVDSAQAARELGPGDARQDRRARAFDGIVVLKGAPRSARSSRPTCSGSNARGSVVTMVDFATLEVQAEVPETNLSAVVQGAPAQLFLDAHPEKSYRGRVGPHLALPPTCTKATVEVRRGVRGARRAAAPGDGRAQSCSAASRPRARPRASRARRS
jgi:HlyD family secretion protein